MSISTIIVALVVVIAVYKVARQPRCPQCGRTSSEGLRQSSEPVGQIGRSACDWRSYVVKQMNSSCPCGYHSEATVEIPSHLVRA